ncbi:hypothetical protein EBZ80_22095, partial [bacterium]|nr:hypothetical protein [bacterium]
MSKITCLGIFLHFFAHFEKRLKEIKNNGKKMSQTLNIVELIERNPITRLTENKYQNELINKIRQNFKEDEQHLFLATFFCYLNYDVDSSFVVNLDNIWKWIGFSRKDHAKRLLDKYFKINTDYIVENIDSMTDLSRPAPPIGG